MQQALVRIPSYFSFQRMDSGRVNAGIHHMESQHVSSFTAAYKVGMNDHRGLSGAHPHSITPGVCHQLADAPEA